MIERIRQSLLPIAEKIRGWTFSQKLTALVATAFVCRIPVIGMVIASPQNALQNDSTAYLDLAANLLRHGAFVATTGSTLTPEVYRTPGYPVFLALFQMIFGSQPVVPVVITQIILDCASVVLVTLVARRLFDSERIGVISGLLVAVNPNQIISSGTLLTETLFCFLMIVTLWLAIWSLKQGDWKLAVAAGLVMAAAAYARHVGIVFAVCIGAFMIIKAPRSFYKTAIPFLVAYGLCILPWMIRNEPIEGRLTYSPQGIANMQYYVLPSVESHRLGINLKKARANIQTLQDSLPVPNPNDKEGPLNAVLIYYVSHHPIEFLVYNSADAAYGLLRPGYSYILWFMGIGRGKDDPITVMRYGSIGDIVSSIATLTVFPVLAIIYTTIYHFAALLLTFYGLYLVIRQKQWPLVFLLFALPYAVIFLTGYQSQSRYRIPGDMLTEMLAAAAVVSVATILGQWYEKRRAVKASA